MKLPQKRITQNRLALPLAFAIPCLGMLCIMLFGGYEPFGNDRSMLYSDMYHQYYPFFVAFRKNLLSGESLLYSWDVGMGMDYLGLISYYLGSPLNLLSVLLPESLTLEYFSLLMPIKLGLAGLFFAIFLKKLFGKSDLSIAFFGSFYGLCAWALGYQWNVMWLDTFALLPLVALGTVFLLRDKKFILYTFSLFLAVCINYYVGFFVCIFVLLLFFCYEICRFPGFKRLGLDFCRIGVFTVLALGMTAFLELPAFAALQNTNSSVNVFPKDFALNIADENTWQGLLDAMRQVAGRMGGGLEHTFKDGLPNLYCGVFTLVLAFLYLTAKEIRIRDKICSVVLLIFFMLSFIIRQLDYVWHGFHFPNQIPYRFSFLYSFVMLYMAYHAWTLRSSFKLWQYIVAALLSVGIIFCSESISNAIFPLYNLSFIALYAGICIFACVAQWLENKNPDELSPRTIEKRRQKRESAIFASTCAVMGLELVLNLVTFGTRFPYTTITNYPKATDNAKSAIAYMKEREKDTPFYRAEVTHTQTLNDGALNNYYGISTFTSSANVRVTNFIKALGYSAQDNYNRYCFEEGSPVSNLFLNLKYMIERDGNVEENNSFDVIHNFGDVYLLENNAYLPLGFLANTELKDVDMYGELKAFRLQNELLQKATGIADGPWYTLTRGSLRISSSGVTLGTQTTDGYVAYSTGNTPGTVRYTYTIDREGFFSMEMYFPERNSFTVYKNGKELYNESLSLRQIYGVSEVQVGDKIQVEVKCDANQASSLRISSGIMDNQCYRQAYEVLAASTLNLTKFSSTEIIGQIDCNRDGLLYTSIPYDGNWTAEVDGKPANIVTVGDAMCALELTEGSHTIVFTYKNKAFTVGLLISIASFLILAGIYVISRSSPKQKGKFESTTITTNSTGGMRKSS